MANTFGILTALVLAFSAFVAYKNKEQHQEAILATKSQKASRDRNEKTYNDLNEEITELTADKVAANKSRDEVQVNLDKQKAVNDALEKEQDEKQSELTKVTDSVTEKKEKLVELGPIKELAPKIERLAASIAELEDQVAVLKAQNSKLRGEQGSTDTASAAASQKLSDLTSGRSLPGMKTSIRTVSRSLGFVTLNGGMNSGVVGGSKVDVMRGGETIAQMNVTAVSANTATADVIQSSLAEGESVSPGDTVVPAKVEEKK